MSPNLKAILFFLSPSFSYGEHMSNPLLVNSYSRGSFHLRIYLSIRPFRPTTKMNLTRLIMLKWPSPTEGCVSFFLSTCEGTVGLRDHRWGGKWEAIFELRWREINIQQKRFNWSDCLWRRERNAPSEDGLEPALLLLLLLFLSTKGENPWRSKLLFSFSVGFHFALSPKVGPPLYCNEDFSVDDGNFPPHLNPFASFVCLKQLELASLPGRYQKGAR